MTDETPPVPNETPIAPPIEASANPIVASTEAASHPDVDPVTAAAAAEAKDIAMADAPSSGGAVDQPAPSPSTSTAPAPQAAVATTTSASTPVAMTNNAGSSPAPPARTGTPLRTHQDASALNSISRAASAHPQDGPQPQSMPSEALPNGSSIRNYLNSKVTQHVLDGMKQIARERPSDPLLVLGEFLCQRSAEVKAGSGCASYLNTDA